MRRILWLFLTAAIGFVLLPAVSISSMAGVGSRQRTRLLGVKTTKDVIVVTRPHFRRELRRDLELMDQHGRYVGEDQFTYLDFSYRGKIHRAWWKSRSSLAPVDLDDTLGYRFLLRLETNSLKCTILRIWRDKKTLWTNPKIKD